MTISTNWKAPWEASTVVQYNVNILTNNPANVLHWQLLWKQVIINYWPPSNWGIRCLPSTVIFLMLILNLSLNCKTWPKSNLDSARASSYINFNKWLVSLMKNSCIITYKNKLNLAVVYSTVKLPHLISERI